MVQKGKSEQTGVESEGKLQRPSHFRSLIGPPANRPPTIWEFGTGSLGRQAVHKRHARRGQDDSRRGWFSAN